MSDINTLITRARTVLPTNFSGKETDAKLTEYLKLCLDDINYTTPITQYTIDTMPSTWETIVMFGACLYANMFLQMNYALKDFNYNDNGLSLNIDRQGKLEKAYAVQNDAYKKMKWNVKKGMALTIGPKGLGQPRFQSQIGQFLKILFGSSYN